MEYIRLALREARLARVPQQLMPLPAEIGTEEEDQGIEDKENVQEFSGVGAISGMSLPLGMSPKSKRSKKR